MARKKPMSAKQRRLQLQEKRLRKKDGGGGAGGKRANRGGGGGVGASLRRRGPALPARCAAAATVLPDDPNVSASAPASISTSPRKGNNMRNIVAKRRGRFLSPTEVKLLVRRDLKTVFEKDPPEEIQRRKEESRKPLHRCVDTEAPPEQLQFNKTIIMMPTRPAWTADMGKEVLERREEMYFRAYLQDIYEQFPGTGRLNYFEHNLEVWRQLWRVIEISDVVLLLADARVPLLHFPPALYYFVVHVRKVPLALVLTKIDLVSKATLEKWKRYFAQRFPELKLDWVTSYPVDGTITNETDPKLEWTAEVRRQLRQRMRKQKRRNIVGTVGRNLVFGMIEELGIEGRVLQRLETNEEEGRQEDAEYIGRKIVTVGLVGHPNVGKSTLVNGLKGAKVVSTSPTPGHTKHFQTIFLSDTVRVCDSPGLTFPAVDMPKALQVLFGLYPIAHCRDPYSAVQLLAERVPLEKVYGLSKESLYYNETEPWSAWMMCEAFSEDRGYFTKGGAPDVYRGANELCRACLNGEIIYSLPPPEQQQEEELGGMLQFESMYIPGQDWEGRALQFEKSGRDVHDVDLSRELEDDDHPHHDGGDDDYESE